MEEQLPAGRSERLSRTTNVRFGKGQVAEFVQHDEVEARQGIGHAAGPRFALQPIDQIDDIVEPPSGAAADACSRDGDGQMGFAGAGSANEDGALAVRQGRRRWRDRAPAPH